MIYSVLPCTQEKTSRFIDYFLEVFALHRIAKGILASAMALSLLGGIAAAEESYYLELPSKGITTTTRITVDVPGENEVEDGINPITGEDWKGSYTPILVNIDSHPDALPHWGVSYADLIYEMPIQSDGSTRSLALFMSDIPSYAGPVRSARVPMGSLREIWGGAWVFYGEQNWYNSVNTVVDVSDWALSVHADARQKGRWVFPFIAGHEGIYQSLFHREHDGNHVAPHDVQIDMKAVQALFTSEPEMHPFLFTDEGLDHGTDVSSITIEYKTTSPAYVSSYYYNETTGLYDRYRNGEPYIDANNGQACAYANVIVIRTDVTWMNGNNSRPVIRLNGQGACEIFQNGRYIRGTWARDCTENSNLQNRMVFLDENGEELPMKVGKTFIQIVDNEQPVVVYSNSAIAGAKAL